MLEWILLDTYSDFKKGLVDYDVSRSIINSYVGEKNFGEYTNEDFGIDQEYDYTTKRGKVRPNAYYAKRQQNRRSVYIENRKFEKKLRYSLILSEE